MSMETECYSNAGEFLSRVAVLLEKDPVRYGLVRG